MNLCIYNIKFLFSIFILQIELRNNVVRSITQRGGKRRHSAHCMKNVQNEFSLSPRRLLTRMRTPPLCLPHRNRVIRMVRHSCRSARCVCATVVRYASRPIASDRVRLRRSSVYHRLIVGCVI